MRHPEIETVVSHVQDRPYKIESLRQHQNRGGCWDSDTTRLQNRGAVATG